MDEPEQHWLCVDCAGPTAAHWYLKPTGFWFCEVCQFLNYGIQGAKQCKDPCHKTCVKVCKGCPEGKHY